MKLSSESVTQQALAATAPPTPVWDQLPWDLTDPRSLRWVASARTAAQGWAVQLLELALYSTNRALGQTQKQINLIQVITFDERVRSNENFDH